MKRKTTLALAGLLIALPLLAVFTWTGRAEGKEFRAIPAVGALPSPRGIVPPKTIVEAPESLTTEPIMIGGPEAIAIGERLSGRRKALRALRVIIHVGLDLLDSALSSSEHGH